MGVSVGMEWFGVRGEDEILSHDEEGTERKGEKTGTEGSFRKLVRTVRISKPAVRERSAVRYGAVRDADW